MNQGTWVFLLVVFLNVGQWVGQARGSVVVISNPLVTYETVEGVWSLVKDPPNINMQAVAPYLVPTGQGASLLATGSVPSGTDIGFASLGGSPAAVTKGFYFDPLQSFSVAIDYQFSATSSIGAGGIGFGIGEDLDGTDSAGVGMGFVNGSPLAYSTAARVNDVDQPFELFTTAPASDGRFFVEYDSATKNVVLGVSATPGAVAPMETKTLAGTGADWDDEPLLVSFFLRSQSVSILSALQSGDVRALFSNFEVLSGEPITIVPEPAASLLAILGALGVLAVKREPAKRAGGTPCGPS
jgi:hypothetical protein